MTITDFRPHVVRGPFNATFFWLTGPLFDRLLGAQKRRLLVDLPGTVVELGSGVGANLRYLTPGSTLVAVEPNPAMHARLRRAARRRGVVLDLHPVPAERTGLADASADAVISSLVLCSVTDPAQVLAEVRRVLRPGGRFVFVEHVAAPHGTVLRRLQRSVLPASNTSRSRPIGCVRPSCPSTRRSPVWPRPELAPPSVAVSRRHTRPTSRAVLSLPGCCNGREVQEPPVSR